MNLFDFLILRDYMAEMEDKAFRGVRDLIEEKQLQAEGETRECKLYGHALPHTSEILNPSGFHEIDQLLAEEPRWYRIPAERRPEAWHKAAGYAHPREEEPSGYRGRGDSHHEPQGGNEGKRARY